MSFKPLTKEDVYGFESDHDGFYLDDVRSAFQGLKADMFDFYHEIGKATIWCASNDEVADLCEAHALKLVDKWFPVFSQSLSEDAKINDGCSQQVTSAPSSEAKSSVSHHVSMGAATVSVAPMIIQSFCLKCNRHCKGVWYYCPNCSKPIHSQSLSQPSGVEAPSIASEVSQQRKRVDGEKTLDFFEEKHGVPAGELSSVSVREVDVKHAARKGCTCKHGSGAITKQFVEENKLCKCECHKKSPETCVVECDNCTRFFVAGKPCDKNCECHKVKE